MKKYLILFAIAAGTMAFISTSKNKATQDGSGIKFKTISLEKAKADAKKNEQLIFIDAYTSWCGPCKKMAATSFKDEAVAELYNDKFINLKIDCEKDADGPELSRLYKIRAYPTLLIIDGDGKLIKQVVGFQDPDRLIALANSVN